MPVPAWLELPASSAVNLPVETRLQELPLSELRWEDFERLCLRLARLDGEVEHCQLYGVRGQTQHGIDLFVRHRDPQTYSVYQCKRVEEFGPAEIRSAVEQFLKGDWAKRASKFVLCVTASGIRTQCAEELETQAQRLAERGVTFVSSGPCMWGCDQGA
jgi:predicted helicase